VWVHGQSSPGFLDGLECAARPLKRKAIRANNPPQPPAPPLTEGFVRVQGEKFGHFVTGPGMVSQVHGYEMKLADFEDHPDIHEVVQSAFRTEPTATFYRIPAMLCDLAKALCND